ncbi:MAG: phosphoadenylyl-sulfate reductase [Anaerolineae bacterium]|mgnify:CR=1 FL=1|nr:phosphoadenylyl-sulfate reductase [Anaerolineae bacterium]MEB2289129.1 phosphoadenylyl-sulfate reductase [Anaerolineae bacterium]
MPVTMSPDEASALNARFIGADPAAVLAWATGRFMPRLAATSSFQTQSVPLLHLISQVCPQVPVLFLDTGYHFPETLAFRDELIARFGLTVQIVRPDPQQAAARTESLYRRDPDRCCYVHKVLPMQRALRDLDAWISGIRRDQTPQRAGAQVVEPLPQGGVKINPLAGWTREDVWRYSHHHDLPAHPLLAQGYLSVGCAPCTVPAFGGDERAGRWAGTGKTECGLHTDALHQPPSPDQEHKT